MFPIRDDNPTFRRPVVTYALIGLNVAAWFVLQGAGSAATLSASVCEYGLIPAELLGQRPELASLPFAPPCPLDGHGTPFSILSSMFMHGGWMHLIGNMWFLWIFGDNVEDSMGRIRFTFFYLLAGAAAAIAQVAVSTTSPIPMVGASGAIGGVMGAYIVLYPRVRIHMLVTLGFFVTRVAVPAFMMLGYWLLLQLFGSALGGSMGGVAFAAHAGGFVAGAGLVFFFRDPNLVRAHRRILQRTYWR